MGYNGDMALLIDGYNLLHVTGIFGTGRGPGGFQRAREALIGFLAASIDDTQRGRTTLVFDAADAPPGLPRQFLHEGMTIRYASDYPDADTLIEELISLHDAPRSLIVVSSDHRIQRAARRRRAQAIDSDRWYAQLCWAPEKPIGELSKTEVDYWVQQFATTTAEVPPDTSADRKNRRKNSDFHQVTEKIYFCRKPIKKWSKSNHFDGVILQIF